MTAVQLRNSKQLIVQIMGISNRRLYPPLLLLNRPDVGDIDAAAADDFKGLDPH